MPYSLQPITDESFFDAAPLNYTIDVEVPAEPDYVWSEFTRQNTLDWCRALKKVTYTSPEPYDAKTTRTAVEEKVSSWSPMTTGISMWATACSWRSDDA